jgi:glycosyltransferase involved in cell wall biosynthesis
VVRDARAHGAVIVVDDCSSDNTASAAQAAGAKVLRQKRNGGYDAALRAGVQAAFDDNAEFVVTMDADGQHPAAALPAFEQAFVQGFDLVVGVRPRTQRLAEKLFARYAAWRFGVHDPLCGMKGYSRAVFAAVPGFDTLGSTNTETLFRGLHLGYRWKEIPIGLVERADAPRFGSVVRGNLRILRSLLKIISLEASYR